MSFQPIAQLPAKAAQGSSNGIVNPGRLAGAIGFRPNGAWLFAYMFRRFGPPNSISDDHKNLASWCITTPKRGCYLCVTPYLGDDGSENQRTLSFSYIIENDLYSKAQKAPPAIRREWRLYWNKIFRWAENRGISIVGNKDLDRRKPLNNHAFGEDTPDNTKRWLVWSNQRDKPRPVELNFRLLKTLPIWIASDISRAYKKSHPNSRRPGHPHENPTVIKQIEKAITTTLRDLMRPTYVRDLSFDANGRAEESQLQSADYYQHAGYPCQPILPKKRKKSKPTAKAK
jgi:hypothetical protein